MITYLSLNQAMILSKAPIDMVFEVRDFALLEQATS